MKCNITSLNITSICPIGIERNDRSAENATKGRVNFADISKNARHTHHTIHKEQENGLSSVIFLPLYADRNFSQVSVNPDKSTT